MNFRISGLRLLSCLPFLWLLLPGNSGLIAQNTGTVTFSSGSGTWTVPANTVSITVECWGAGGGGGAARVDNRGGGGGGGGGYARATFPVAAGASYTYTVGAGGTGGAASTGNGNGTGGGDTYLNTNQGVGQTIIRANGGGFGNVGNNPGSGSGGAGGASGGPNGSTTTDGTNAFISNGGNGAAGVNSTYSGGGGGGAGTANDGVSASASNGGAGGADLGGNGANGWTSQGTGIVGATYGGGGSGGYRSTSSQAGGNGAVGFIRITYVTCEALTITCPTTANPYNTDAGTCVRALSFSATTGGGCGTVVITPSIAGETVTFPHDFPVGSTTVVFTATDDFPNTATCSITVTVEDNEDPTATCQPYTVALDANGAASIVASDIDNGSDDNCNFTLSASKTNFDCTNLGANTVTLTVTDDSGNKDECVATVTVVDEIAPTAICKDISINLDANGAASIEASDIDNGSDDNCNFTLSASKTSFNCTDLGANTVTLTVTDDSDNESTCVATVTVEDDIDPTASCQAVTIYLDAAGTTTITAAQINNGSADNCGIDNLELDLSSFDCTDLGANTVTLTVTDDSGNEAECEATVTVVDNIDPVATCVVSYTVELGADGTGTLTAEDIDNGSSDNCGIERLELDMIDFDCTNLGPNTVTLTATDDSNNESTCFATVTVVDDVKPTAVCKSFTVALGADGTGTLSEDDIDGGSTDNCTSELSASKTDFTCEDLGERQVTLTVRDDSGNEEACVATVTVVDEIAPTATCQDISIYLDANGAASIEDTDIDNGSDDNCDFTLSASIKDFTCVDLGPNTVTLTVTDGSENSSTCTATVTVVDNMDPTALCQPMTIFLDDQGKATITEEDINNGSFDNCDWDLSVSQTDFTCNDLGNNPVTLTVTDDSENSSTCVVTVMVVDNTAPEAKCKDLTIYLNAAGSATITTGDINDGSSDNCAIASLDLDATSFDCTQTGANTVTLTVTDDSDNESTCEATVTVVDNTDPEAKCKDVTIYLDATGSASITTADINDGSTDNCDFTLSASQMAFTCDDLGDNPVTLTATDDSENDDECVATVTVEDTQVPVATCQDVTVYLDDDGNGDTTPEAIDNGSSDNCELTLTLDKEDFTAEDLGENTVTLTVEDAAGNKDDCKATVHVMVQTSSLAVSSNPKQYSDQVTFTATIDRGAISVASPAADSARFFVGTQYMGNAKFEADGIDLVAELDACLLEGVSGQMSPGTKNVTVVYTQKNPNYEVSEPSAISLTIAKEDLDSLMYSGFLYFTTPGPSECNGTITLGAYVADKDDTANDDCRGDVRKSTISWHDGSVGGPQLGTSDATALLDPDDLHRGLASTEFVGQLTGNACNDGGKTWDIYLKADNYYTGTTGPFTVTLAKPGLDFVTGGGFYTVSQSSGQYAATSGSNMNYGFTMKWNPSGKNLKGQINVVFRRLVSGQWKVYQIKSNAINSMSIVNDGDYKKGYISTKANLQDITNPLAPISLGGNLSLSLEVWDNQEENNGSLDRIGVDLRNGNSLLFSSHWAPPNTTAQTITGGQINVRNGNGNNNRLSPEERDGLASDADLQQAQPADAIDTSPEEGEGRIVYVRPNPFRAISTVGIRVTQWSEVSLLVYNASGMLVRTLHQGMLDRGEYNFPLEGSDLPEGFYICRMTDGRSVSMQSILLMR